VAAVAAFRVVPLADGGAFLVSGNPSGGRVQRLAPDGTVTSVAGTGSLGRHVNGIPATRAAILPSDVAVVAGGALLIAQTEPVAAIRRVSRTGTITTFVRLTIAGEPDPVRPQRRDRVGARQGDHEQRPESRLEQQRVDQHLHAQREGEGLVPLLAAER
jgi:hypothetical protein